jgi:hypothetical protein
MPKAVGASHECSQEHSPFTADAGDADPRISRLSMRSRSRDDHAQTLARARIPA